MSKQLAMINGLPSDLAYSQNYINTDRGMVRGGAAVWNADGELAMQKRAALQKANAQNAMASNEDAYNEENVERGLIPGGAAVWNADGESEDKKRGKILFKRLALINEFLVRGQGSNVPFGAFLKRKGLHEGMFLAELPSDLQFVGISNETPSSRRLLAYGVAMNKEYETQYLQHIINTAPADLSCDGCGGKCGSASADGDGAAKVACNLKYPPPRTGKRKDAYNACLKTQAAKIVEKRDEKKAAGIGGLGNIAGVVNKTNPALVLMRSGVLGLTRLNAINFATNLGKVHDAKGDHWNKIVKKWVILGGDLNSIKSAISAGRGKKPLFAKKKVGADGLWESATGDELAVLAGLTATVTAINPAAGAWVASATVPIGTMLPVIAAFKRSRGEALTTEETLPVGDSTGNSDLDKALADVDKEKVTAPISGGFMDKYKFYVVGGLVLAMGITALVLTAKNPKGVLAS